MYKHAIGDVVGWRQFMSREVKLCRITGLSFIGADPAYTIMVHPVGGEVIYVGEDDLISSGELMARRLRDDRL